VIALIFDMDGVIIDSNPVHREAWEAYNRRFGVETTDEMHERMYGKRNDQIVRDYLGDHLSDEEVLKHGAAKESLFREMIASRLDEFLVPGLQAFLDRHRDLRKAVASNAEAENVEFVLKAADLARHFSVVLDGHQVSNPKPAPDVFLRAAELLGVRPQDCVVFEDSHAGVQAGVAAGMQVVGVRTTHDKLPGASLEVDDFLAPELEEWLRDLMGAK
jgi:beta-phosphoglucomutase family hydrolase